MSQSSKWDRRLAWAYLVLGLLTLGLVDCAHRAPRHETVRQRNARIARDIYAACDARPEHCPLCNGGAGYVWSPREQDCVGRRER